ncbi:12099_t:CDS:2, partial [Racocetra fulgida]
MPTLFDSHQEFSEWFSKDIESHAENKGSLNEHQLKRLHMILKPFMLRRVKKNVQNELGDKIEKEVFCQLTARQRTLYRGLRDKISVTELLEKAATWPDNDNVDSLMNLVMQFRKVYPDVPTNTYARFLIAETASKLAPMNIEESSVLSNLTNIFENITRHELAISPPIQPICIDKGFYNDQEHLMFNPFVRSALSGIKELIPHNERNSSIVGQFLMQSE